jgi:hypothetical protein
MKKSDTRLGQIYPRKKQELTPTPIVAKASAKIFEGYLVNIF